MIRRVLGIALGISLLVGAFTIAREITRPAAVAVEEQTIKLEPGELRTVHATVDGGMPVRERLSWHVEPSWLGTIDEHGNFRAGSVSGSGKLTADFGTAHAQVAVTVACPKERAVAGIHFAVSCGRSADVYLDVAAPGTAALALASVERNASLVSSHLQIPIDKNFRVYIFGSTPGYINSISELGREFSSGPTAFESDGLYIDVVDIIALDRSHVSDASLDSVLRHELTHRMLRQFVGHTNISEVPTWLNEGLATLEEYGAVSWLGTEARYVSASMAHSGRLPSLASLTGLYEWNSRTGLDGFYQYYVAAQAAQFLIDDIKPAGLRKTLEQVRRGDSFGEAYTRAARDTSFGTFTKRFEGRVDGLAQVYPGIASTRGSPRGAGSSVVVYGLPPNTRASFTLSGPMDGASDVTVDEYGVAVKYLGPEYAAGEYLVTLETQGTTLSVKAFR
jgi:hypothetical protein